MLLHQPQMWVARLFLLSALTLAPKVAAGPDRQATRGALTARALPAERGPTELSAVRVRVERDPKGQVNRLRFHVRLEGIGQLVEEAKPKDAEASVEVSGARVEWWVELLGAGGKVLLRLGSAAEPLVDDLSKPVPEPPLSSAAPAGALERPLADARPPNAAPVVLLGVAALAAGTGVYFGLQARSARAAVDGAEADGNGVTVGMSQQEAMALDAQARQSAVIANVLFASGALLGAGGLGWLLWDGQSRVTPTPGGLLVSGALP